MVSSTVPFTILPEPMLAFGSAGGPNGFAVDPQRGLLNHGPYSMRLGSPWHPKTVRIFFLATEEDWETGVEAIHRINDFERIPKPAAKLRVDYPGFEQAFHSRLIIEANASQKLPSEAFKEALKTKSPAVGYRSVLSICGSAISGLGPLRLNDVVVLMLPQQVVERYRRLDPGFQPVVKRKREEDSRSRTQLLLFEQLIKDEASEQAEETLYHDLRRSLKVMCMRQRVALQLINTNFCDEDEKNPWAYKLWNISTAVFSKAGGIPWRLESDEGVAYCGIRFGISKTRRGQSILVGLAQLVNSSGQLVALKAGQASRSERRSEAGYYLTREQGRSLLQGALRDFEAVAGRLPERVVVHKSSPFKKEEVFGMEDAVSGIRDMDLVHLKDGTGIRLLPDRGQPADRGAVVPTSENSAILYTTGYVPESDKYRGMHVPTPVELVRAKSSRPLRSLALDVLRLTKMNWNTTIIDLRLPCTFDNATEMIGMMKELRDDESLEPHIRYYM